MLICLKVAVRVVFLGLSTSNSNKDTTILYVFRWIITKFDNFWNELFAFHHLICHMTGLVRDILNIFMGSCNPHDPIRWTANKIIKDIIIIFASVSKKMLYLPMGWHYRECSMILSSSSVYTRRDIAARFRGAMDAENGLQRNQQGRLH